jgi:hypothetical protein
MPNRKTSGTPRHKKRWPLPRFGNRALLPSIASAKFRMTLDSLRFRPGWPRPDSNTAVASLPLQLATRPLVKSFHLLSWGGRSSALNWLAPSAPSTLATGMTIWKAASPSLQSHTRTKTASHQPTRAAASTTSSPTGPRFLRGPGGRKEVAYVAAADGLLPASYGLGRSPPAAADPTGRGACPPIGDSPVDWCHGRLGPHLPQQLYQVGPAVRQTHVGYRHLHLELGRPAT